MGSCPKIAIVVPCYNERVRLRGEDFLRFAQNHQEIVFLFIDDGSTDETKEMLAALVSQGGEQLLLTSLPKNQGKAEAVRQGILEAIKRQFAIIGYWDADQATPLTAIPEMYSFLQARGAQAVFASRVRLLGHQIQRKPLRHYLGRGFATCVSFMLGIAIYDSQCGAKLFVNDAQLQRIFQHPFVSRWIFDVEILARYWILHGKKSGGIIEKAIIEYPLERWEDVDGSRLTGSDFFKAAVDLLRIARRYVWSDTVVF